MVPVTITAVAGTRPFANNDAKVTDGVPVTPAASNSIVIVVSVGGMVGDTYGMPGAGAGLVGVAVVEMTRGAETWGSPTPLSATDEM